jgi:hypothetical protein
MHPFKLAAAVVTVAATTAAAQSLSDPDLLGCWQDIDTLVTRENGTTSVSIGQCARYFTAELIFVTCTGPQQGERSHLEFEYTIERKGSYNQRLAGSSHTDATVDYARPHEYTIEQGQLRLLSFPRMPARVAGASITSMSLRATRPSSKVTLPSRCLPRNSALQL